MFVNSFLHNIIEDEENNFEGAQIARQFEVSNLIRFTIRRSENEMSNLSAFVQLAVTLIVGIYFFTRLLAERSTTSDDNEVLKKESERLNRMRHIHLTEPLTENMRPKSFSEIVGQEDGIRALMAALSGKNPQHVIIYGPPGIGKTAAARLAMEAAKRSHGTPFAKDAPFVEADATIMRFDERSIADPLIGSVHDPIYQGAGGLGVKGVPEPKEGAVSKAHGGVLFLDEIGELHPMQMNKLLKVLEDRKVMFESSYYKSSDKKIPLYIHDVFQNGIPADFRLIGATTRRPDEIPPAVRSRCAEVFFNPLTLKDIRKIIAGTIMKTGKVFEAGVCDFISLYASNGRDAVKMIQTLANLADMDGEETVTLKSAQWAVKAGHFVRRTDAYRDESVINISMVKPE